MESEILLWDCYKCNAQDSIRYDFEQLTVSSLLRCESCGATFKVQPEMLRKVKGENNMANVPPPPPPPSAPVAPSASPAIPPPPNIPVPPQFSTGITGLPPPPPQVAFGVPSPPPPPPPPSIPSIPTVAPPPPPMVMPSAAPPHPPVPPVPQVMPVVPPPTVYTPTLPPETPKVSDHSFSKLKTTPIVLEPVKEKERDDNADLDYILNELKEKLIRFHSRNNREERKEVIRNAVANPFKPDSKFKDEYRMFEVLSENKFHSLSDIQKACGSSIAETTFRNKLKKLDGLAGLDLLSENDHYKFEFKQ